MAEAKKQTETIIVTKVALTLDEDEAKTLRAILEHVGGDDQLSPKKHANAIRKALGAAGISSTVEARLINRVDVYGRRVDQGVRFSNYDTVVNRAWGSI